MTTHAMKPPVTNDLDALWTSFAGNRDDAIRARLVAAYQGFTRMMAAKLFARRNFAEMEFADYMQYASVGLLESIDRFQPARGIRFETFASTRITGAILNGIGSSSEIQEQIAARRRVIGQRLGTLRDAPALPEAGSAAAVFATLAELAIGLAVGFVLEDSGMHMADHAEYQDSSYQALELKQLRERVRARVATLPANQKKVIEGHYLQHQTFDELASSLQLSRGRIAQIHKEALGNLRLRLTDGTEIDLCC